MHAAQVTVDGSVIRWVEVSGAGPARVYLHGLGASAAVYFAATAARPEFIGRRQLLVDMLGFGISDRPADAGYTLQDHADWIAAVLVAAGIEQAEVVGHSMGGSVAIVLAARHPRLVESLVAVDANLDPAPPTPQPGSSYIARFSEEEFLATGWDEVLGRVGPQWAATMRLGGREALYRSAVHLARGTTPTMRKQLLELEIPRTFLYPAADGKPDGATELAASGVRVVGVTNCGHNIMIDNPDAFAAELTAAFSK